MGVWERSPQPPEITGGLEADPPVLGNFWSFSIKNTEFGGIFKLEFL